MQQYGITPDIQHFRSICTHNCEPESVPLSREVINNIVRYDGEIFRDALANPRQRRELQSELILVLESGPGVFTISKAYSDLEVIDEANHTFDELLSLHGERSGADHFAKTGANGRLWNSFQKHALHNPKNFINYYKNPVLDLAASAWLGPYYQMTAQVNIVRPGGQAQSPHRDYHLGFQTMDTLREFPLHTQEMSAKLTLQAAIAHSDMPVESGPTLLLPYSHKYKPGYMAWQLEEFQRYFSEHAVQLPLKKGDAVFFNPALFHAAGSNQTTDFHRRANLLQISSVFGKTMESVNLPLICESIYTDLQACIGTLSDHELHTLLGCISDGYSFPTNLDTDPPTDDRAPQTHRQLLQSALMVEKLSLDDLRRAQKQLAKKRLA